MELLEIIYVLRKRAGFSQKEIAEKLGIDASSYSRLEKGEIELTIDKLNKIAEILEVPVSYFFNRESIPQAPQKSKGNEMRSEISGSSIDQEAFLYHNESKPKSVDNEVLILKEKITLLERLLEEKERLISVLMKSNK